MIIVGIVLLATFGLYQRYLAPSPFMPWHFLTDRSVIGACLLNMTYQVSYYCWNYYFTSFLQVVYNVTVAEAGYINSTFQVVSGVLLFVSAAEFSLSLPPTDFRSDRGLLNPPHRSF